MSGAHDDGAGRIEMESGVSAFTGKPYVAFRWGAEAGQLTPDECAAHGLAAVMTAMAADHDSLVWAELTDPDGLALPPEIAARFLQSLRRRREAAEQE